MNKQILTVLVIVLVVAFGIYFSGSTKDNSDNGENSENTGRLAAVECPTGSENAKACISVYEPVCANGTSYSNSCFACVDADVDRYFAGRCDELGDVGGPSGDPSDNTLLPAAGLDDDKEDDQ